jgi:hypothetical protein
MADKKPGPREAGTKSSSVRKARKKSSTVNGAAARKVAAKQTAPRDAKAVAKSIVVKKIAARKPVPIKKARVGKRAVLPPLPPPPTAPLKWARSPARQGSRAKAAARNKVARRGLKAEIASCTEAALREKLRLAAPYVAIWLGAAKRTPKPIRRRPRRLSRGSGNGSGLRPCWRTVGSSPWTSWICFSLKRSEEAD